MLVLICLLLLGSVSTSPASFGDSEEGESKLASDDRELVTVSGFLNVREIVYFDGRSAYDYLLMVNEEVGRGDTARYLLQFSDVNENPPEKDLLTLAGSEVIVKGYIQEDAASRIRAPEGEPEFNGFAEEKLNVKTIEFVDEGGRDYTTKSESLIHSESLASSRTTLEQVVVPARYADIQTFPHTESYYTAQFYADARYSLAAYWRDASYGEFGIDGKVTKWIDLPGSEKQYLDFGGRENALVTAADHQIDFDGADNEIQNISPGDVRSQNERDDIDSLIGIYNGMVGPSDIAGYSYLEPIRLTTDEGSIYSYFIAITDTGYGSAAGVPSNYFVGLAAHEMGHNLGWYHTATKSCVYCDPWSLMSGGIYSELGPSGPIASHRESEDWIDSRDILQITSEDRNEEQIIDFNLEFLGKPAWKNYLMAKVLFGDAGEYYTIEARENTVNDHTPSEQTGLLVYHYSPTGHSRSLEPRSFEMIVDTTGIGDFENADIEIGDSFVDLKNKITIANLGESKDYIAVRVTIANDPSGKLESLCDGLTPTIIGTSGNDILWGTEDRDVISGLAGNDLINGHGGNDVICGGQGDDSLDGGDGDDRLFGNLGNDEVAGGRGNDEIVGGRGDDDLSGGDGNDIISGWSNNDHLVGGDGDDQLFGGDGDDYMLGGDGHDKLRGWLGNDVYADKTDNGGL